MAILIRIPNTAEVVPFLAPNKAFESVPLSRKSTTNLVLLLGIYPVFMY